METSLPETVAKKKRVLPQWMLESGNQQHADTTTVSSHKKQKERHHRFFLWPTRNKA